MNCLVTNIRIEKQVELRSYNEEGSGKCYSEHTHEVHTELYSTLQDVKCQARQDEQIVVGKT